ncbi:hypothetical protein F4678DRAFT_160016 [Xylaria arbuscula]|nr:hypothetical protein F4678DRAFT_160016 [Xylaria arbuscula]
METSAHQGMFLPFVPEGRRATRQTQATPARDDPTIQSMCTNDERCGWMAEKRRGDTICTPHVVYPWIMRVGRGENDRPTNKKEIERSTSSGILASINMSPCRPDGFVLFLFVSQQMTRSDTQSSNETKQTSSRKLGKSSQATTTSSTWVHAIAPPVAAPTARVAPAAIFLNGSIHEGHCNEEACYEGAKVGFIGRDGCRFGARALRGVVGSTAFLDVVCRSWNVDMLENPSACLLCDVL